MCILCGEFVEQLHWTEMERNQLDTIISGQFQRDRKRSRIERTKICNDILKFYDIDLQEWNNVRYILTNKKGKTEVLNNLGQIWDTAEKMAGRPIDPLNEKLLEQLQ